MGKFIQYQKDSSLEDYEKKLEEIAGEERARGNKIVVASGDFDFLNPKDISYLRKIKEAYKKENAVLFVNIDNDSRVKLREGPTNPVNKSYNRAFIVSNLKGVDYVSVHPEEKFSPLFKFSSVIKPDYIVQETWTDEMKRELKHFFLENPLPETIGFEKISDIDFSKISMGQFIQFEQYEGMPQYRKRLEELVKEEREKGKIIVLNSGTFDILIPGHVHYLNRLKEKYPNSVLFVNIDNDAKVKSLKGKRHPTNTSYNRAFVISNLGAVDYATVHPEEKSYPILSLTGIIKPDYLVMPISLTKESRTELRGILGEKYDDVKKITFTRGSTGTHTTDLVKKAVKFYGKKGIDFEKFNSIYFTELSEKLRKSRSFDEFFQKNPEAEPFIKVIKELTNKSKKYIDIRSELISNILRLKEAYDLSSYGELNDFISELAKGEIQKPVKKKFDEVINPKEDNLKSDNMPTDADLAGGGD